MRFKKGFTLYELVLVVAILGILLGIAVPSIIPATNFANKNKVNTMHKICMSAVDSWIKSNYDPIQRPDNFNSRNSQGVAVYQYIKNNEIFDVSNLEISSSADGEFLKENPGEVGKIHIQFEKGVLKTSFIEKPSDIGGTPAIQIVYGVYDLDSNGKIANYDERVRDHYIVGNLKNDSSDPTPDNIEEYAEIVSH